MGPYDGRVRVSFVNQRSHNSTDTVVDEERACPCVEEGKLFHFDDGKLNFERGSGILC